LRQLVQVLSQHRLGLKDVQPDILGRAFEYLLRKFAEGQGQSAGEFYTPPEVAILMARILDPQPGKEIYDPACGSAGLLIETQLRYREKYGSDPRLAPLRFYGQEINPATFAMSRMNVFIHDMDAEIALGDTMNRPAFLTPEGSLRRFGKVTANPMWNQKFATSLYENDPYGRFGNGIPPSSSAD
jgi:type I restriction enzyme M protein